MKVLELAPAWPAFLALILLGCASIEERGLAHCTGHDRRPLNADLWDTLPTPELTDQSDNAAELNAPGSSRSATALATSEGTVNELITLADVRWNIAASEHACG